MHTENWLTLHHFHSSILDYNSPIAPGSPYHQLGDDDSLESVANVLAPIEAPEPEEGEGKAQKNDSGGNAH